MTIPDVERRVLQHLDYFRQLTTGQIRTLVFPQSKSRTSCDRVLARMVRDNYVMQLEKQRPQGGRRGGSGEYVYMLGPAGWRLVGREGRFRRESAIDYHTLTIAELYTKLREAERSGVLKVVGFTPEPECWLSVHGNHLKPDLLVELERPITGARLTSWLEIDLSTQRQARLTEKMERYKRASESITDSELEQFHDEAFPLVVFVCHSQERRDEIAWLIERRRDEPRLFRAVTIDEFPLNLG